MSAESFLSSAVEAAVGIGGFAGIVAAIRQRSVASWSLEQNLLLRMLLIGAAMATTFALLPAILAEAGLREPTIWRIGSASLLGWQVGIAWFRIRQFREGGVSAPFGWALGFWVLGVAALQALNLGLGEAWPYLLGVFGLLLNSFTFFLMLLLGGGDEASLP